MLVFLSHASVLALLLYLGLELAPVILEIATRYGYAKLAGAVTRLKLEIIHLKESIDEDSMPY